MFLIVVLTSAGIFYLYKTLNPESLNLSLLDGGPVTSAPVSLTLSISSPDDNQLLFTPDILIQGKTIPNALVLISSDNLDSTLTASNKGDFSYTATLPEGATNFTVMVFDNEGNSKSEERLVYYSKEKI